MKILQVVPELGLAGAETMVENLVNNLDKKKYEIKIISLYSFHSAITDRLESNNIEIIYLNKKKGLDLSIYKKLKKIFDEEKPDIIHTHRYVLEYVVPSNIFSSKSKVIHTVHNIATKEVNKKRRIIQKYFFHRLNVTPVAISEMIRDTILQEYKIDGKKVPVVLNGVDLNKCIPKKEYDCTNTILNIGRMSEQKNQIFLIDVFSEIAKKNTEYKLKIIGDGVLHETIQKKITELNLNNRIIIEKNKATCFKDYHLSDVFVMTSKWEGIPMTIIEAMGTGLPIVASNVGGIPNMIDNEINGIILDLSKERFVSTIIDLMNNKKKREYFGKNAREKSKLFTAEEMARKYEKIYDSRGLI